MQRLKRSVRPLKTNSTKVGINTCLRLLLSKLTLMPRHQQKLLRTCSSSSRTSTYYATMKSNRRPHRPHNLSQKIRSLIHFSKIHRLTWGSSSRIVESSQISSSDKCFTVSMRRLSSLMKRWRRQTPRIKLDWLSKPCATLPTLSRRKRSFLRRVRRQLAASAVALCQTGQRLWWFQSLRMTLYHRCLSPQLASPTKALPLPIKIILTRHKLRQMSPPVHPLDSYKTTLRGPAISPGSASSGSTSSTLSSSLQRKWSNSTYRSR